MADPEFQFREQIDFFRQKVNLPTASWTAIQHDEHDRAFVVAGAMRDDLLTDFRQAVDRAISDGATLADFRKDFDHIVDAHGWTYNGGRNWRSRVIYETNLRTSYAAGRWAQIQEGKAHRPFVRYRHNDSVLNPRAEHQAWDGLVLPADDAWLKSHWPPNGWGCRCYIESLSQVDLDKLGKAGPDTPPPSNDRDVAVGTRGPNPRVFKTPEGVDPGFGYAPGASWSRSQAKRALDDETASSVGAWQPALGSDWRTFDRPQRVPLDRPVAVPGPAAKSVAEAAEQITRIIGAPTVTFDVHGLPVLIDAAALAAHLEGSLERTQFLPLLLETLNDPFEVWVSQEVSEATGETRLRARVVKAFALDKGRSLLVVADAAKGYFRGWTVFPTSQLNYLQKQRVGVLLYGR